MNEIQLTVDWWATIGRWGSRHGPAAACWAVGIMAIIMWDVLGLVEGGGKSPTVTKATSICQLTSVAYSSSARHESVARSLRS